MANKKITQLDALTSAAAAEGDVLPIVDLDADQTKKIQLGDLKSGSFVGTSTGLTGQPSIEVSELSASQDAILGGELYFTNLAGGGTLSTNQVLTRDATTGQIYITGSYANAGGGGGGGSAFPFTGSAEITGSLKMIGPITSSGEISGSNSIFASRIFADSYVESSLFQGELGTKLESPAGIVGITGSTGVEIKTSDPLGDIKIDSSKDFTNSALGKYTLDVGAAGAGTYHLDVKSGGIRISSSGGSGIDPVEIQTGDEDGLIIGAGAIGIDTTSQGMIITTGSGVITKSTDRLWLKQDGSGGIKITGSDTSSDGIHIFPGFESDLFLQSALGEIKLASDFNITQTAASGQIGLTSATYVNNSTGNQTYRADGNMEITASGLTGLRVSSSRFNLEGAGNSEIKVGGGSLSIQGSENGDVTINAGTLRNVAIQSEGGNVTANAANVIINDNAGQSTFHVSASGIHLNQEDQFYQIISNLPTTEPTVAGQLWASGSGYGSASGSKYIMIKQ